MTIDEQRKFSETMQRISTAVIKRFMHARMAFEHSHLHLAAQRTHTLVMFAPQYKIPDPPIMYTKTGEGSIPYRQPMALVPTVLLRERDTLKFEDLFGRDDCICVEVFVYFNYKKD